MAQVGRGSEHAPFGMPDRVMELLAGRLDRGKATGSPSARRYAVGKTNAVGSYTVNAAGKFPPQAASSGKVGNSSCPVVGSLDPSLEIDLSRGSYSGPLRQAVGGGKTGKSCTV
jgi:hypothetical protein